MDKMTMPHPLQENAVHVYIAKYPFAVESDFLPPERQAEIKSCKSEKVRTAKFYVWKLLEIALLRSFGRSMKEVRFTRSESGKWECDDCYFSLSHSGEIAAVAISLGPVGADIERKDDTRFSEALAKKILTEREEKAYLLLEESARPAALHELWTKKEALFKCFGKGSFTPRNVETADGTFATRELACGEHRYILTVASNNAPHAVFLFGEGLVENQS